MSDLLVVVPPGWTDETEKWNAANSEIQLITQLINDKNWVDVTTELQAADIVPPSGSVVSGASFMTLDDGVHLWVRYE